ncbi:hypothetical protein [Legionella cardiaca]|uniref:Uncharacterized protein n=1 Tax=Legionella cardiaca TaxID=1071983 RepID=A0ABY8ARV4_9GAMM|nr:hypothetical protein [Legionella cardiaca]WED43395.1 hypothetical protein PXX05_01075 [Legionella cardiaca]
MPGIKILFTKRNKEIDKNGNEAVHLPSFLKRDESSRKSLLKAIIFIDILNANNEYPERTTGINALQQCFGDKKSRKESRKKALGRLNDLYHRLIAEVTEEQSDDFYLNIHELAKYIDKIKITNREIKNFEGDIGKKLKHLQDAVQPLYQINLSYINDSLARYQQKLRVTLLQSQIKTELCELSQRIKEALQADDSGLVYQQLWAPLFTKLKIGSQIDFYWFKRTCDHLAVYPSNPEELKQLLTRKITVVSNEPIYFTNDCPGSCTGEMPMIERYEESTISWSLTERYKASILQKIIDEFHSQYLELQIKATLRRLHLYGKILDKEMQLCMQENQEDNLLLIRKNLAAMKSRMQSQPNKEKASLISIASLLQQVSKKRLRLPLDIENSIIGFAANPTKKICQFGGQGNVMLPSDISADNYKLQDRCERYFLTFFHSLSGEDALDKAKKLDAWEFPEAGTLVLE